MTGVGGGKVLQVVNFQTGAVATGTTVIPFDDTIPQITEGDEYMTLAITPTSATSKLRIDVVVFLAHSAVAGDAVATTLFQDTTASALATSWHANSGGERVGSNVFSHTMTSGATSVTTFKVRAGGQTGGTTTLNGRIAARSYGGSVASSITITEYEV